MLAPRRLTLFASCLKPSGCHAKLTKLQQAVLSVVPLACYQWAMKDKSVRSDPTCTECTTLYTPAGTPCQSPNRSTLLYDGGLLTGPGPDADMTIIMAKSKVLTITSPRKTDNLWCYLASQALTQLQGMYMVLEQTTVLDLVMHKGYAGADQQSDFKMLHCAAINILPCSTYVDCWSCVLFVHAFRT